MSDYLLIVFWQQRSFFLRTYFEFFQRFRCFQYRRMVDVAASGFKGGHKLLYTVLSLLLFVDFLYFQNFGNLPSIKEVVLLPQVGDLGGEIKYFIDLYSLLFVADLPFVWFFFKENTKRTFSLSSLLSWFCLSPFSVPSTPLRICSRSLSSTDTVFLIITFRTSSISL